MLVYALLLLLAFVSRENVLSRTRWHKLFVLPLLLLLRLLLLLLLLLLPPVLLLLLLLRLLLLLLLLLLKTRPA